MMVFKMIADRGGDHVHVRVFSGPDKDHLKLNGTLVFLEGEWSQYTNVLDHGVVAVGAEYVNSIIVNNYQVGT